MHINLPRIKGTAYDALLNDLITSVNTAGKDDVPAQPLFAASAAAAIGRFLMEKTDVKTGGPWIAMTVPLVGNIPIMPMADMMYNKLVELAK